MSVAKDLLLNKRVNSTETRAKKSKHMLGNKRFKGRTTEAIVPQAKGKDFDSPKDFIKFKRNRLRVQEEKK